ncbi:amino acid permease [Xylogone sp. PMI_703]|nr:amino acid permease [Xylogone sp. PMI_703]
MTSIKEATEKDAPQLASATTIDSGQVDVAPSSNGLERGLKSRHIQFIALGGTIGTGLFLGIGGALHQAGPLSLFLGYAFTSAAIWAMMQCLGEMTTWLPLPGMIAQLGTRFVDPAFGFAIGWNQWYNCAITICGETSAAVILVQYWDTDVSISPAVWITVILVIVIAFNFAAVSIYGEIEFIFASIKIVTIIGLLILAIVIDLGGGPDHHRLGFTYWKNPGVMKEYIGSGSTGRFLGLFSVLINAAFAYGGVEQVAVAAGEAKDPIRNIPRAIKGVFYRILVFYVFGAFAVACLVSSNDPNLLKGSQTARSPWVIAITRAGIPVLPHIINAVVITSAVSSANANLYTGSRYLYTLALQGQAPKVFEQCNKLGVPYVAVATTAAIGLLTYMTVSAGGSTVFGWFQSLIAISYLLTWASICFAYTRFHKALNHHGVSRNDLDFRAPGTTYTAWFGVCFFCMVILFNGFAVFTRGNWSVQGFITAYIGIPIFASFYLGWKLFKKTKMHSIGNIDIFGGREEILNSIPHTDPESRSGSILRRVWEKIL